MKYLIVDDSKLARLILAKSLEANIDTPEIIHAENGKIALELIESEKPDVAFLDLTMPVMDGYEALPLMLKIKPNLKVIVVSADIQDRAKNIVIKLGALLHIQKPINPKKMREILKII